MSVRKAQARWEGDLRQGQGTLRLGSGAFEGQYSFKSRFEEGTGTNPEELIGAAHAGCFSMFLSAQLTKAGTPPTRIDTTATVHLGDGPTVTKIELETVAIVPGIDAAGFDEKVKFSKENCPISKALAAVPELVVNAKLG
jgi:osmotically inducible protein OsmC